MRKKIIIPLLLLCVVSCGIFESKSLPKETTIDADSKYFITHGGFEGSDGRFYFAETINGVKIFVTPDPDKPLKIQPYQIYSDLDSLKIRKYYRAHSPVKLEKSQVYLIEALILSTSASSDSSAVAGL